MFGMGKGWARGLTKESDERVRRATEGHRGRRYRPRTPGSERRGNAYPRALIATDMTPWTPELAYAVGLIATDGCLSSDGRHVIQVSKDRELLETFKACIGSKAGIGFNRGAYRVQVADVVFYRWLETIGLTPRKSLTLGAIDVPDRVFLDLTRGLLDGDGSVIVSLVIPNPRRYPGHQYERLRVQFHSASDRHVYWLRDQLTRLLDLDGWIGTKTNPGHRLQYVLRYSKHEAMRLLEALYQDPAAPRLDRKWSKWIEFRDHGRPTRSWTAHPRRARPSRADGDARQ